MKPARRYPPRNYKSSRRPPKRQRPSKGLPFRLRWLLILLLFIPAISYTVSLDNQVRGQFEGKRWALPARVYARPLELYPGMSLNPKDLAAELRELGYVETARLGQPGEYRLRGNEILVHARRFKFWDGVEPARQLKLVFGKEPYLTRVIDLDNKQPLALARLEPMLIGKIYPTHNEDRILVRLEDVPNVLVQALMAMEDRSFYDHHGISLRAIARALLKNVQAGEWVQGGSTITQQLIKNYYLSPERTLSRKFTEALMAILLELHYEKDQIMEAYLNEVYLGQAGSRAIHGVGMASWFYFNRPVSQLKLSETALLVGLLRAASHYNPRKYPERAIKRRNLVLSLMAEQGMISQLQAETAKTETLNISAELPRSMSPYPAFMELVRKQLQRDYREEDLRSEGLQVFTTLDPIIQRRAEETLARRIRKLEKEHDIRKMEGATLVTEVENGEVLAVVGSRQAEYHGFNRALNAVRPIGSLVKPAVYLTALEKSHAYSLLSTIKDEPLEWKNEETDEIWTPSNYDGKTHGKVPLYKALANSYNLATVHLGFEVGLERVLNTLHRLGVKRDYKLYPSLLLGGISMTPLEVAQMYQTIASGGFRVPLRAIRNVLTHDGRPLNRYALSVEQSFDPAPVFLLNYALQEVVRNGTAALVSQKLPEVVLAGKTGTTNDFRDSWFAGFGNDLLSVVWLGRDDNQPINLSGSQGAMRVWGDLMEQVHPQSLLPVMPNQVQWRWVRSEGKRVKMPFIIGSLRAEMPGAPIRLAASRLWGGEQPTH